MCRVAAGAVDVERQISHRRMILYVVDLIEVTRHSRHCYLALLLQHDRSLSCCGGYSLLDSPQRILQRGLNFPFVTRDYFVLAPDGKI